VTCRSTNYRISNEYGQKKGPGVLCPVFLQLEDEILLNYFSRFLDVEERNIVCPSIMLKSTIFCSTITWIFAEILFHTEPECLFVSSIGRLLPMSSTDYVTFHDRRQQDRHLHFRLLNLLRLDRLIFQQQ